MEYGQIPSPKTSMATYSRETIGACLWSAQMTRACQRQSGLEQTGISVQHIVCDTHNRVFVDVCKYLCINVHWCSNVIVNVYIGIGVHVYKCIYGLSTVWPFCVCMCVQYSVVENHWDICCQKMSGSVSCTETIWKSPRQRCEHWKTPACSYPSP